MHLFLDAAGTCDHQQSSHAGHTARLCAFTSGLRLSAVAARIWLSHGSPAQFLTFCSVDKLWLHQLVKGQSSAHPLCVWCCEPVSRRGPPFPALWRHGSTDFWCVIRVRGR